MATSYIEVLATQSLAFNFGADDAGREMYSCNYTGQAKAPIDELALEMAGVIVAAGLGTIISGSTGDLYTSPKVVLPPGDGPFTLIKVTGGISPVDFHNGDQIERFSFQVITRGNDPTAAENRANAIRRVLHGIRSTTLSA